MEEAPARLTNYATRCQGSSYLTAAAIFLPPSSCCLSPPCGSLFLDPEEGYGILTRLRTGEHLPHKLESPHLACGIWLWSGLCPPGEDISEAGATLSPFLSCEATSHFSVPRKSVFAGIMRCMAGKENF